MHSARGIWQLPGRRHNASYNEQFGHDIVKLLSCQETSTVHTHTHTPHNCTYIHTYILYHHILYVLGHSDADVCTYVHIHVHIHSITKVNTKLYIPYGWKIFWRIAENMSFGGIYFGG